MLLYGNDELLYGMPIKHYKVMDRPFSFAFKQ